MDNCMQAIQSYLQQILLYSGRGIGRMGLYRECTDNEYMRYRWTTIYNHTQGYPTFNIGLCLPFQCDDKEISQFIDGMMEEIGIELRVLSINSKVEEYSVPFSVQFYFTIVLITILTLTVIISTLAQHFQLSKNKLVKVFSIQQSIKIFHYKNNSLNIFNGVKTCCMLWIIMGHQYFFNLNTASNSLTFFDTLLTPFFLIVEAGMLAVDVFLFVGGFFVGYVILKEKSFSLGKLPATILNRMLRFWPSLLIAIFIFYSVFMHLGSGPFWSVNQNQAQMCQHWWRSMLFIDNFVDNGREICMNWSWYLQIDMQLFIFSAIILMLYKKRRLICVLAFIISIIASLSFTFYMNHTHNFKQAIHLDDFGPDDTSFTDVYTKPWCRCTTYIYGILFSVFYMEVLHKINSKNQEQCIPKQSKLSLMTRKLKQKVSYSLMMEILGTLIILFIIFIPRTSQIGCRWDRLTNALYLTFSKPLYVFGLSLLLLPSLLGCSKSFVRTIMDNKFTNFLSKLSFMMYLVHLLVIMQYTYSRKYETYYNALPLFVLFLAHATFATILALYLVIIIEIPCYKLQKILISKLQPKPQNKIQEGPKKSLLEQ